MIQIEGPNASPETKAAWFDYKMENPGGADAIIKVVNQNSRGVAKTYGTDFWNQYVNVMEGKIQNSDQLAPYLRVDGKSPEDSPITNTGFVQLNNIIDAKNKSPQESAFQKAQFEFFKQARGALRISGVPSNFPDSVGSEKLQQFMQVTTSRIQAGLKAGKTADQLFNPKSADYVGNNMGLFQRTNAQKMQDWQKESALQSSMGGASLVFKDAAALKQAVDDKKISRDEAIKYGLSKGWVRKNDPQVPIGE